MTNNITDFHVEKHELIVNNIEEIAEVFDKEVKLKHNELWINKGGEGITMEFIKKDDKYILEYINSKGEFSGSYQEDIEEIFKKNNGILIAKRTWEDGTQDEININLSRLISIRFRRFYMYYDEHLKKTSN